MLIVLVRGLLLLFIHVKLELLNSTSIYETIDTTVTSHIELFTNIYRFQDAFLYGLKCTYFMYFYFIFFMYFILNRFTNPERLIRTRSVQIQTGLTAAATFIMLRSLQ